MRWNEIVKKNNVALLQNETDTSFVVATGYNPEAAEDNQWNHGHYYTYAGPDKAKKLSAALEFFRIITGEKYIPRCRVEELLTLFKDGLVEDDPESANEYFEEICELSPAEMEWLGLDEQDEE